MKILGYSFLLVSGPGKVVHVSEIVCFMLIPTAILGRDDDVMHLILFKVQSDFGLDQPGDRIDSEGRVLGHRIDDDGIVTEVGIHSLRESALTASCKNPGIPEVNPAYVVISSQPQVTSVHNLRFSSSLEVSCNSP